tara:strand:+ start:6565 stop:7533 length:969 start_codon:yes stop_codon:yes gene_type:complete
MNKYLNPKYIIQINPADIVDKHTICNNLKTTQFASLVNNLNDRDSRIVQRILIELHLSGYTHALTSKLYNYFLDRVNVCQPGAISYVNHFNEYYSEYGAMDRKNSTQMSNDQVIRNYFIFMGTLLCKSDKRSLPKLPKIHENDFDISTLKSILISKNLKNVLSYVLPNYNKNIIVPFSEIINHIKMKGQVSSICYWISWLFAFEKQYHNKNLELKYRIIDGIDEKHNHNFVWIVWDMLLNNIEARNQKYVRELYARFKTKFSMGSRKQKMKLFIFGIVLHFGSHSAAIDPGLLALSRRESLHCNIKYRNVYDAYTTNKSIKM